MRPTLPASRSSPRHQRWPHGMAGDVLAPRPQHPASQHPMKSRARHSRTPPLKAPSALSCSGLAATCNASRKLTEKYFPQSAICQRRFHLRLGWTSFRAPRASWQAGRIIQIPLDPPPPPFLLLCLCCHQKREPPLITSHFALLIFLTGSNFTTHATYCLFLKVSRKPAALQFTFLYRIYTKLHTLCPNKTAFRQSATLWSLCNRFKYLDMMHRFQKLGDLTCCLFNYTRNPSYKRSAKICFGN